MYAVFRTEQFEKEVAKKFSPEEQTQVRNLEIKQLRHNPYVGDPLGYKFLREKKVSGKRVYYLIYEDFKMVLLVQVSNKKQQQEVINKIKAELEKYYLLMESFKLRGEFGLS